LDALSFPHFNYFIQENRPILSIEKYHEGSYFHNSEEKKIAHLFLVALHEGYNLLFL
jgi:hypothetical protein